MSVVSPQKYEIPKYEIPSTPRDSSLEQVSDYEDIELGSQTRVGVDNAILDDVSLDDAEAFLCPLTLSLMFNPVIAR